MTEASDKDGFWKIIVGVLALLVGTLLVWYLVIGEAKPTFNPVFNALWNFWIATSLAVAIGAYWWLLDHTLRYRRSEDDADIPPGLQAGVFPAHRDNPKAEAAMFIGPTLLVGLLFFFSWAPLNITWSDTSEGEHDVTIEVTGVQWAWSFERNGTSYGYIDDAGLVNINVTCGESVLFIMESEAGGGDAVLHSFYLPAFAIKEDVVPGLPTRISITPDVVGSYDITCAEYCGFDHAYMRAKLNVLKPAGAGCL